jgi:hypothetical protein
MTVRPITATTPRTTKRDFMRPKIGSLTNKRDQ